LEELKSLLKFGKINETTQVCKEGDEAWFPLINIVDSVIKNQTAIDYKSIFQKALLYFISAFRKSKSETVGVSNLQVKAIIILLSLILLINFFKQPVEIIMPNNLTSTENKELSENGPLPTSTPNKTIDPEVQHDSVANIPKSLTEAADKLVFEEIATPKLVDAALKKAKNNSSVENWENVAILSNALASSIGVVGDYFSKSYDYYKVDSVLEKAVKLEQMSNDYKQIRNDAYLEIAKIYLNNGQKIQALNISARAVNLSGGVGGNDSIKFISNLIEVDYEKE
jgi:hypothetical protein